MHKSIMQVGLCMFHTNLLLTGVSARITSLILSLHFGHQSRGVTLCFRVTASSYSCFSAVHKLCSMSSTCQLVEAVSCLHLPCLSILPKIFSILAQAWHMQVHRELCFLLLHTVTQQLQAHTCTARPVCSRDANKLQR